MSFSLQLQHRKSKLLGGWRERLFPSCRHGLASLPASVSPTRPALETVVPTRLADSSHRKSTRSVLPRWPMKCQISLFWYFFLHLCSFVVLNQAAHLRSGQTLCQVSVYLQLDCFGLSNLEIGTMLTLPALHTAFATPVRRIVLGRCSSLEPGKSEC